MILSSHLPNANLPPSRLHPGPGFSPPKVCPSNGRERDENDDQGQERTEDDREPVDDGGVVIGERKPQDVSVGKVVGGLGDRDGGQVAAGLVERDVGRQDGQGGLGPVEQRREPEGALGAHVHEDGAQGAVAADGGQVGDAAVLLAGEGGVERRAGREAGGLAGDDLELGGGGEDGGREEQGGEDEERPQGEDGIEWCTHVSSLVDFVRPSFCPTFFFLPIRSGRSAAGPSRRWRDY